MAAGTNRVRVRPSTPAEIEAGDDVDVLEQEVDAEDAGGHVVDLPTDDGVVEIVVPPAGGWRQSANRALRAGDFDGWAKSVLSDDDYEAWVEADATNDQVGEFFENFGRVAGASLGESRRSARSSRSTKRR